MTYFPESYGASEVAAYHEIDAVGPAVPALFIALSRMPFDAGVFDQAIQHIGVACWDGRAYELHVPGNWNMGATDYDSAPYRACVGSWRNEPILYRREGLWDGSPDMPGGNIIYRRFMRFSDSPGHVGRFDSTDENSTITTLGFNARADRISLRETPPDGAKPVMRRYAYTGMRALPPHP